MPYLGNIPATNFSTMSYQDLTGGTGTSFTLDFPAGSAQDIEVYVNNVRQEPGVAYTVAGTALTMTGSIVATDDFYVVFQGKAQQTAVPGANTITTAMLQSSAVTNAKIDTMAASKLTGALPAIDGSALTGIASNAGSEYFEADLTTDQASLTDATSVVVDFGGSGTVVHDTASNFDSANDAYLLDSSNGVYIISFSCVVASNTLTTETLIYGQAGIEIATDGSTYSAYKAGGAQVRTSNTVDLGSVHFSGSFIYKATTATTKIRLTAFADNAGTGAWRIPSTAANAVQPTGSSDLANARPTWMSIIRIA